MSSFEMPRSIFRIISLIVVICSPAFTLFLIIFSILEPIHLKSFSYVFFPLIISLSLLFVMGIARWFLKRDAKKQGDPNSEASRWVLRIANILWIFDIILVLVFCGYSVLVFSDSVVIKVSKQ